MFAVDAVAVYQRRNKNERQRDSHLEITHDISYVVLKTEVDHSIGFVHTKELAAIKVDLFLLQHVDQPSRCRNYDMNSLA